MEAKNSPSIQGPKAFKKTDISETVLVFRQNTFQEFQMDIQFYPTPFSLAVKAWAKFQNRDFSRILEPSAGAGDLLKGIPREVCRPIVDVCEIDMEMHSSLRELDNIHKLSIVGVDFLVMNQGAMYSHVVMNPPFAQGVQHLLHAWNLTWNAEIVCILNTETIRNPFSAERRQLNELIARHGSVEFIEGGFTGADTSRKTDVDVALVWLKKTSEVGSFVVGDILNGLRPDEAPTDELHIADQSLAIPSTVIENFVIMFDQAVAAARESVKHKARADYLGARLGGCMSDINKGFEGSDGVAPASSACKAAGLFGEAYADLKDRAWANVLHTADFQSKMSSGAKKQVQEAFETIKQMQFTTENVHGFLRGILENQGQIQNDMMCEVFDLVCRYHSENASYYKGWKSNDKHRTLGMRLKTTRFILPRCGDNYFKNSITYAATQMMGDIDKVFSMLDGVNEPAVSLQRVFKLDMDSLTNGVRVETSYFDVRFYPGIGTIHFFPKRKDLMDRLNRFVGKQRKWLPPNVNDASTPFWTQYEKAESMDKAFRAKCPEDVIRRLKWSGEESGASQNKMNEILSEVHGINGIADFLLESGETPPNEQLLLLAA